MSKLAQLLDKVKEIYVYDSLTGEVFFVMQEDGTMHQAPHINVVESYKDSYKEMVNINGRMFLSNFKIDKMDINKE